MSDSSKQLAKDLREIVGSHEVRYPDGEQNEAELTRTVNSIMELVLPFATTLAEERERLGRVDELQMALESSKADGFPNDMLDVCSWIIKRLTLLDPNGPLAELAPQKESE